MPRILHRVLYEIVCMLIICFHLYIYQFEPKYLFLLYRGVFNEAPQNRFTSEIPHILKSIGRHGPKNQPFLKDCGIKPPHAKTNCVVNVKPCLYNITADPCEYHNLADAKPEIVKNLYNQMVAYNATAVKPRNKPVDPEGFPVYHGGIWVPWVELDKNQD